MHHYIWQNDNWSNFTWDEKKLLPILSRVRLRQGELISKIKSLKIHESIKAYSQALVREVLQTAKIEGENYSLDLVRSSVNRRLGLSFSGLPKVERNVDGLVEVLLDATINSDKELSADRLKSWQAALFPTSYSGLRKIEVGNFRNDFFGPMQVISGPIGKEKVHYEAPPAKKVSKEVINFLSWWERTRSNSDRNTVLEGIVRAGIAHFYFITIHPFDDGNGRIARALTDLALAQDDKLNKRYYSLSGQILKKKKQYYNILEKTQKGNSDLTEWLVWFLNCFELALKDSDDLLANIFDKVEFWRKHQDSELSVRQKKAINKLLDIGKNNFKGGLTNKKYASLTKVSRATAYREILDLLEKKILKQNDGEGRSVNYDLKW